MAIVTGIIVVTSPMVKAVAGSWSRSTTTVAPSSSASVAAAKLAAT
jgi:hypothetical protein